MGHSSQDPHLCWTTRLLGGIIFLCACSTLAKSSGAHGSGIKGFRTHTYLKAIRGGSVLLHVIQEPEDPKIEEITWGFASDSNSTFMLRLQNGKEDPLWFSLQDKYKQRVQMPSMSSLRINNLTSQDSGQYWAQIMCQTGREIKAVFNLTVYDPVPLAQIQTTSVSITPSWCNVTLDCGAREAVEVLNVTWEVQGPPSEREQRGAPGPPNPWTLALSLPLRQPNVSLTCVLSNPVDQKNATFQLVDLCSPAQVSSSVMGSLRPVGVSLTWNPWDPCAPVLSFLQGLLEEPDWSVQSPPLVMSPLHPGVSEEVQHGPPNLLDSRLPPGPPHLALPPVLSLPCGSLPPH
ncbi:CD48 antigen-like isoform X4 [Ictidomys tridecemlineatus]